MRDVPRPIYERGILGLVIFANLTDIVGTEYRLCIYCPFEITCIAMKFNVLGSLMSMRLISDCIRLLSIANFECPVNNRGRNTPIPCHCLSSLNSLKKWNQTRWVMKMIVRPSSASFLVFYSLRTTMAVPRALATKRIQVNYS